MKRIQQESNVSCRVRGVNDSGNDREIAGAMDLIMVTKSPGKYSSLVLSRYHLTSAVQMSRRPSQGD